MLWESHASFLPSYPKLPLGKNPKNRGGAAIFANTCIAVNSNFVSHSLEANMRKHFHFFLLIFLLFLPPKGECQQVAHDILPSLEKYGSDDRFFQVFLDNDKFSWPRLDEDRDYSNGIVFSLSSKKLNKSPLTAPGRWLLKKMFRSSLASSKELAASVRLGSLIYTPRDIAEVQVIRDDRPYASVQYLESVARIWFPEKQLSHTLALRLGVWGTTFADFAQTIIHIIGPIRPIPEGWPNQISNPWEPTGGIHYTREKFGAWNGADRRFFSDYRQIISLEAGWRMRLGFPLSGRFGLHIGKLKQNQLFLFGRVEPHIIGYDVSLQGQFRSSVHVLNSDQIRNLRVVGGAGAGMCIQLRKGNLHLGYGFYGQSPEADYPSHTRNHFWGRFWLGYQIPK